jgi:hypothetical protein
MGLSENTTNRGPGESSMLGIEFAPGIYNDPSGLRVVSLRIVEGGHMTPLVVYPSHDIGADRHLALHMKRQQ